VGDLSHVAEAALVVLTASGRAHLDSRQRFILVRSKGQIPHGALVFDRQGVSRHRELVVEVWVAPHQTSTSLIKCTERSDLLLMMEDLIREHLDAQQHQPSAEDAEELSCDCIKPDPVTVVTGVTHHQVCLNCSREIL